MYDNVTFTGLGDDPQAVSVPENSGTKTRPFAIWTVGGTDYRLKLKTSAVCALEDKLKCNLISVLDNASGLPPLSIMLSIAHAAMKDWNHGITYATVQNLFDQYCDEGGTQLKFLSDVLLEIYRVSGFFTKQQEENLDAQMGEVKGLLG